MVRRHGLEHPRGIVDRRVTEFVWLDEVCVTLVQWEYSEDCVSSGLNTWPLQPDVQLRQQLELVYQIIVYTKLTGSIS